MNEKLSIDKGTIISAISLVLAITNMILTERGFNPLPFSSEVFYGVFSELVVFGTGLWAWYRNNSTSQIAIAADKEMRLKKLQAKIKSQE